MKGSTKSQTDVGTRCRLGVFTQISISIFAWQLNQHLQCFLKGPQLRTWSPCGPNWWNDPHLGRISHQRSPSSNYGSEAVKKGERRVNQVENKGECMYLLANWDPITVLPWMQTRAFADFQLLFSSLNAYVLYHRSSMIKNLRNFVAKCAF